MNRLAHPLVKQYVGLLEAAWLHCARYQQSGRNKCVSPYHRRQRSNAAVCKFRPRWYLALTISDSSIWTVTPTPPSCIGCWRSFQEQTSRKNWNQSTTVFSSKLRCWTVEVTYVFEHQKYISSKMSPRHRWALEKKVSLKIGDHHYISSCNQSVLR